MTIITPLVKRTERVVEDVFYKISSNGSYSGFFNSVEKATEVRDAHYGPDAKIIRVEHKTVAITTITESEIG